MSNLDPMPLRLLIECMNSSLPSLTDLFNYCPASGIFPQCLLQLWSHVLLKKVCLDHNDMNNYWPVSNLCIIAEILENIILFQASSYLNSHNLHNTCLSAHHHGLIIATTLLIVIHDLFLTHIKDNIYLLALLVFSSEFDSIDQSIVVHSLHTDFGISDAVLQWFSSFLTDRTHHVSLSNNCSAFASVHTGEPQFSVLVTVIFAMHH